MPTREPSMPPRCHNMLALNTNQKLTYTQASTRNSAHSLFATADQHVISMLADHVLMLLFSCLVCLVVSCLVIYLRRPPLFDLLCMVFRSLIDFVRRYWVITSTFIATKRP